MRQFDDYVVRTLTPPRVVLRIVQVVLSVGFLVLVVAGR